MLSVTRQLLTIEILKSSVAFILKLQAEIAQRKLLLGQDKNNIEYWIEYKIEYFCNTVLRFY